jgi:hypothetical protein
LFQISTPPPPLFFCKCGGAIQIQVLQARLGRWEYFFQSLFVDEFFYLSIFGEMVVDNVFIYYVQELFGHCTFIIHIAFLKKILSIAYKCLS